MAVSSDLFDDILEQLELAKDEVFDKALTSRVREISLAALREAKGIQIALDIIHKVTRKEISKLDIDITDILPDSTTDEQ